MLAHRYGIPLCHPATRHPAAGRDRAGRCQPPPPLGGGLGLGAGRDRHLEGAGPDALAVGAFAGAQAAERPGGAAGEEVAAAAGGQALMGKRSPQARVFAAAIGIMGVARPSTAIWRSIGNTCFGMRTLPPCMVRITAGPRSPPAWR